MSLVPIGTGIMPVQQTTCHRATLGPHWDKMNDHLTRAYSAYFDACMRSRKATVFPSAEHSGIESFNTKIYVTLRDYSGTPIVVYRLRGNGHLRKILRWPPAMQIPPRPGGVLFKRLAAVPPGKIIEDKPGVRVDLDLR